MFKPWWICPKCGWEYVACPYGRIRGIACPACAGKVVTPKNCLAARFPKLAAEWHPIKNCDLTPDDVTSGSNKRVWWICSKCDHRWQASIGHRKRLGQGCPACSGRIATPQNCLAVKCPRLTEEWHPTKNSNLTPNDVVPKSNKKVWWVCEKCKHEWRAAINKRSDGNGCPVCAHKVVTSQNCLAARFPELAKEWHPTRNGEMTPYDVMPGSGKKIWWMCFQEECKYEWRTKVRDRSKGHGCPACSGKVASPKNCLAARFPKLAAEWHPIKNEELTPDDVTSGSNKRVWWKCQECEHVWITAIYNRSSGTACPACADLIRNQKRNNKKCQEHLLIT